MSEQATETRPRESAGCTLGISAGLVGILALTAGLFALQGQALEAEEVLAEHFSWSALPFGLEVDGAARLPDGNRVVRLAHPDYVSPEEERAAAEKARAEADAEATAEADAEADDTGTVDEPAPDDAADADTPAGAPAEGGGPPTAPPMSRKIEMIADTPPQEVFLVFPAKPEAVLTTFEGKNFDGDSGGGRRSRGAPVLSFGGPLSMDRGEIRWGEYHVGYRHERTFAGDTANDEVRVNLSGEGRLCVLVARWPSGHAGSAARVEQLLADLAPR